MLSTNAQNLIKDYISLPFKNVPGVRCPYFNNVRMIQRGQLRVLTGKGTPKEIVEEAKITSIQYGYDIFDVEGNCCACQENKKGEIKKYLVDHHLGIDCSGFICHVLDHHYLQAKGISLSGNIFIVPTSKILRWIISRLRPVENISVRTFANDANSKPLARISDLRSADLITMLETGPKHKRDHILLITDIKNNVIKYAHARAWSGEGKYGNGVAEGEIKIIDPKKGLLEQEWIEFDKSGDKNETYLEAKNAKKLEIRRLKI
ncbi:MAG: hypothetical protein ABIH87_00435 [bacterium]